MNLRAVLVVEDDPDIQDYVEIVLSGEGLEIIRAGDGREALRIIDSGRRVDLVLLDAVMPVMNGEEFYRGLKVERRSEVPVILSSVDEATAERIGAISPLQGVFMKGGRGKDLKALVRKVLAGSGA